jgi:hypothetical protein
MLKMNDLRSATDYMHVLQFPPTLPYKTHNVQYTYRANNIQPDEHDYVQNIR